VGGLFTFEAVRAGDSKKAHSPMVTPLDVVTAYRSTQIAPWVRLATHTQQHESLISPSPA
jgi:hypothetical protein